MKRKLQNNNNSLIISVPKEYVKDLGLKVGQQLDFKLYGDRMIVIPVLQKEPCIKSIE
ncbi:MAG: AbrB/MazE/SpoVT family DNA-binding domain-containing protein [Candidatus Methanoperedens sp.]|nr:AbrB/MazE/SpoVT family DNA-binding domain-containing protein [Candidatus Methanoperedens sp.]